MSENERDAWNRRYRAGSHSSAEPDAFLVSAYEQFVQSLFPQGGTALDVAGGTGRHAIFLAQRGWRVTLTDISDIGLERARQAALGQDLPIEGGLRRGSAIELVRGDARDLDFGREQFDLVLVFFYLEREVLPKLTAALRPGGLIVYKTYTREHEKFAEHGLTHPMYFLEPNELLHAFDSFRVLHYNETVREKGIAELVAQKSSGAARNENCANRTTVAD